MHDIETQNSVTIEEAKSIVREQFDNALIEVVETRDNYDDLVKLFTTIASDNTVKHIIATSDKGVTSITTLMFGELVQKEVDGKPVYGREVGIATTKLSSYTMSLIDRKAVVWGPRRKMSLDSLTDTQTYISKHENKREDENFVTSHALFVKTYLNTWKEISCPVFEDRSWEVLS